MRAPVLAQTWQSPVGDMGQQGSLCTLREPVSRTRKRAESDEIVDYYLVNPIMYVPLEAEYQ